MKVLLNILFAVLLTFSFVISPSNLSSAQINYPMTSTYVGSDTDAAVAAGKEIYGYTIFASGAANATCALYDAATTDVGTSSNIVSETGEAVKNDSHTIWFPKPIVTANGCSIAINNSEVIIYHQP